MATRRNVPRRRGSAREDVLAGESSSLRVTPNRSKARLAALPLRLNWGGIQKGSDGSSGAPGYTGEVGVLWRACRKRPGRPHSEWASAAGAACGASRWEQRSPYATGICSCSCVARHAVAYAVEDEIDCRDQRGSPSFSVAIRVPPLSRLLSHVPGLAATQADESGRYRPIKWWTPAGLLFRWLPPTALAPPMTPLGVETGVTRIRS